MDKHYYSELILLSCNNFGVKTLHSRGLQELEFQLAMLMTEKNKEKLEQSIQVESIHTCKQTILLLNSTAKIGKLPPIREIIPPKAKGINKENNKTTPKALKISSD